MEEKFEIEFFKKGLKLLSSKMEERNLEPLNLYVIGGFCMLIYGYRNATRDIDAYYELDPDLDKAIFEVGQEIKNPEWLNNNVSTSSASMFDMPTLKELLNVDNSFDEYCSFGRIKIYIATHLTLLYTKLISFRDNNEHSDVDDIIKITQNIHIPIIQVIQEIKSYKRTNDDFENMVMNFLMICYQSNIIAEKEYEQLYFNFLQEGDYTHEY